ncbi:TraB domain containing [Seminavis robusta]|uniref:TraB domain containing n=1 Tax=Seminavis robusta TaxID=568900 RepID=A0A9N8EP64_9STRA|nr:TraB domain containing [Seminavis robusta]|eukprot:Sro1472_g275540.1 TraB domain containing (385) ;mRNA; f:24256-25410
MGYCRRTASWLATAMVAAALVLCSALVPVQGFLVEPNCSPCNKKQSLIGTSKPLPLTSLHALALVNDNDNTIATITTPDHSQTITLIGTAHLSQKSNEQVQQVIQQLQPQCVMVELDPDRLVRIGIDNPDTDISIPRIVTAQDIVLQENDNDINSNNPLTGWIQNAIADAFSKVARGLLTDMYNDMSDSMSSTEDKVIPGGEFLAAIRAAEQCPSCHTLVLGDRSSTVTIKRAALLALQSGNPLAVLSKLEQANAQEMKQLEVQVREQLQADDNKDDAAAFQVAMMEALKADDTLRDRLFQRLERDVPEFTQAFLKERDWIMAESIRRELTASSTTTTTTAIVGVVGLAHVPGMVQVLQDIMTDASLVGETVTTTTTDEPATQQ